MRKNGLKYKKIPKFQDISNATMSFEDQIGEEAISRHCQKYFQNICKNANRKYETKRNDTEMLNI